MLKVDFVMLAMLLLRRMEQRKKREEVKKVKEGGCMYKGREFDTLISAEAKKVK